MAVNMNEYNWDNRHFSSIPKNRFAVPWEFLMSRINENQAAVSPNSLVKRQPRFIFLYRNSSQNY